MLKILSMGLIATAMLTTAVSAREYHAYGRYEGRAHHASVFPFASGAAGADTVEPSEQPGGICDHGDDPQVC